MRRPSSGGRASAHGRLRSWTAVGLLIGAAGVMPAGIADPQHAWQNWTLNCQGCHRPDGSGSAATAPPLKGSVARFLAVPGGRDYLVRVPGVATSALSDADLAEVLNWLLRRFDPADIPAGFKAYTAAQVGRLRKRPLRLRAASVRRELLAKAARPASR